MSHATVTDAYVWKMGLTEKSLWDQVNNVRQRFVRLQTEEQGQNHLFALAQGQSENRLVFVTRSGTSGMFLETKIKEATMYSRDGQWTSAWKDIHKSFNYDKYVDHVDRPEAI